MTMPNMIVPLHQQRHRLLTYYLALSLVLTFLTIYPYLTTNKNGLYCSAFSSDDLNLRHSLIDKFDIIESDDIILSKSISTRSVKEQLLHERVHGQHLDQMNLEQVINDHDIDQFDAIHKLPEQQQPFKRVHFSTLGRSFSLVLEKPGHLTTEDLTIITLDADGKETKVPFNRNDLQVMEGYVDGETRSLALASFSQTTNNLMTAQIVTGHDTIMVEPAYLHKNELRSSSNESTHGLDLIDTTYLNDKYMIAYNLRDHKQFNNSSRDNIDYQDSVIDLGKLCGAVRLNDTDSKEFEFPKNQLDETTTRNRPNGESRVTRDIESSREPSRDKTRCTLHLVADYLFYKNVGNGDSQTTINYLLALINRVNLIYLPTVWETGDDRQLRFTSIGFTVQNITIHKEYTRVSPNGPEHYNMQRDKVWGARDFLDNFSRNSPPRHYCLAHLLTYRKFDSPVLGLAYVASTRFGTIGGICSPTQQRGDSQYKHNSGISTSRGIYGETLITRQADLVLAHELGHNLGAEHDSHDCRPDPSRGGAYLMHPYAVMGFEANNRVFSNCSRLAIGQVLRRKAGSCFIGVVDNVCGNGVVEGDEECDAGGVSQSNCCDSYCRLTPGSQCSDRHSWCCSGCHIAEAGRPCRPAEEHNCRQSAYCDGRTAECPEAPPVEDYKTCVGRGLCQSGQCIPFCEARGLQSCLCNTPSDACKLCCKPSPNSTCTPYDTSAPYLPDGVLCYRGVCEKGRCEQPIQDVVERLWDVIEDINFTTLVKFLRDNIILVVLVASIPIWCVATHYINEFDKRIKQDVINTLIKKRRRKEPPSRSPFLPRLFVGDNNSTNSIDDTRDLGSDVLQPLKPVAFQFPGAGRNFPAGNGQEHGMSRHSLSDIGFRPPEVGFQLAQGEEVAIERGSIAMNSIELPHQGGERSADSTESINGHDLNAYSTQV